MRPAASGVARRSLERLLTRPLSAHTGKLCLEVSPTSKIAMLSEELCIGCGICVKVRAFIFVSSARRGDTDGQLSLQKCPFEAIMIINLPKDLEKDTTHRYGTNTFKLHR